MFFIIPRLRARVALLQNILAVLVVAHNTTLIHSNHTLPQGLDHAFVVCSQNNGRAKVVNLFQNLNDLVGVDRIEVAGRLISDNNVRMVYNSSSNSDALS